MLAFSTDFDQIETFNCPLGSTNDFNEILEEAIKPLLKRQPISSASFYFYF